MRSLNRQTQFDTKRQNPAQRRNYRLLLAIPVSLSALLTGCGDSNESKNSSRFPAPLHACEILNASELETMLGAPVSKPEETHKDQDSSKHWMSMCIYYSEEKQLGMGISILPHGRSVIGEQAFTQHETELKEAFGNDYKQEIVAEVGDYAGWDSSTKQLTAFQGPYMVITGVNSPKIEDRDALKISRKVSQQFIANIPE